jgi:hypothetical protein
MWLSGAAGGTPCSRRLRHSSRRPRRRGSGSGTRSPLPAASARRRSLPSMPMIDWVADSGATNHTTPHSGHISSPRPPSLAHPSSNIVGNGSVLPVTSVSDSVLPGPFYLNDVLLAPNLVQSLLSIRRFTTDNSCFMEFDPFDLSVKDLPTRRVLVRYDSTGPLYTLPLPTLLTTTPRVVPYALATTASSATWHHCLGHPDPDVLSMLSSISAITCPQDRDDSLCHACQLGRHVRLPFPSSSIHALQLFDLVRCDLWTSPVPSVSSYKYYLIILDNYTHYCGLFRCARSPTPFPPSPTFLPLCPRSLVIPFGASNAIMDTSLITLPPALSSSLTVSNFGCRVPTLPRRTTRPST